MSMKELQKQTDANIRAKADLIWQIATHLVTQCFLDNNDSFSKLFNDPDFYQKVQDAMAAELYKALRKD